MIKVTPSALRILVTSCMIAREVSRSKLPVGSSIRTSRGLFANALAIATRCCSPALKLRRPVPFLADQPYLVKEFSYSFLRHYAPCYRNCPSKVLDGRTRFPQDASSLQLSPGRADPETFRTYLLFPMPQSVQKDMLNQHPPLGILS